jgi:hypothetical protein
LKKVVEWNNLTFIVEDDAITVFDHKQKKEPLPEDKHTLTSERKRELLKAVFNALHDRRARNDEVYWVLAYLTENPTLILFHPAQYLATHKENEKQ